MKLMVTGFLVFLLSTGSVGAATHISGTIHKISFEAGGNPYIVEQDIIVPADVEVTIKEGCVLLFKPFTTLTIQGKLVVEGTADKAVVFTSIYDSNYNQSSKQNANPFDWNGIVLTSESGGTIMNNFVLGYSVFGVKSQSQRITVRNGLFRQNGQYHFTINDRAQFVQDDIPFSYNSQKTDEDRVVVVQPPAEETVSPEREDPKPAKDRVPRQKKIFRYTCLGVGIVGVAIGTGALIPVASAYSKAMKAYNSNPGEYDEAKDSYEKTRTSNVPIGMAFEVLGALGMIGFGATFLF